MALGSAGSIKGLIPVGFMKEQALTVGIYMSDPGILTSNYNLFPQFTVAKRAVFNLPLYSFQVADQIARTLATDQGSAEIQVS